jgi:pimeloyl-ACP methyl ester carboxylesterase
VALVWLFAVAACRAAAIPESQRFPSGTPFVARTVTVDGTRLLYIEAGHGPPVMLLHGLGASVYSWRKTIEPLAIAGYHVVAFDNRGFGASGKPSAGYGNAALAALVVAVMDSLHFSDAVVVGHSMGGAIAGEVALRYPDRVRGLVLIDAAGYGIRAPLVLRLARLPFIGAIATALRGRHAVERLLRFTYAKPSRVTPADVDQYYAPVAAPDFGPAFRAVLREFNFAALRGRLGAVRAPTLVMWGADDRMIPAALGRAMATDLQRGAFVLVPDAGHDLQEEAPDEVNRTLIAFLRQGIPQAPPNLALH